MAQDMSPEKMEGNRHNLAEAQKVRQARKHDRREFKARNFDLMVEVLMHNPIHWQTEIVWKFLSNIHQGGPGRSLQWCQDCQVAPQARLGSLTDRQRTALATRLREFEHSPRRRVLR